MLLSSLPTPPWLSLPGHYCSSEFLCFKPSATLVLIARVQKLEAQIATLLHHIQPWMQKSIVEVEDRVEKNIALQMERKIQAVHQRLNAFQFRVLAWPSPTIDLTTL